ncbi:hypothetical protein Acr_04g0003180 [Actinidia rufa]|uniref:Uncharacterized protein n=1 Tax=Actinidia rufa TaxID=165716 RepID=A0A7J0EGS8_9ERIC|nr:hypothetical protein Acr_04g0003180 [Actinidia rufa]
MNRVLIEKSHIPTNPWREALLAMAILAMVILMAQTKHPSKRGDGAGEDTFQGRGSEKNKFIGLSRLIYARARTKIVAMNIHLFVRSILVACKYDL